MSGIIKKASALVNNGPPSSFYGGDDKSNPVFQSLDQELKLFAAYMKKRAGAGYRKPNEEASSRACDTLFEVWNKYETRIPLAFYQQKLLEVGDFLVSVKEYNLALWQCYGRYLKYFGDIDVMDITDKAHFKEVYFPGGFQTENAGFTFRALMGRSICFYQAVRQIDPKLQNAESVDKCLQLLAFLRLVTQIILPKESLCWLVYNGTIQIYSICRHLMSFGHASHALQFMLWASMCMESSVPLLGVRYLSWRSTLYTAVCQCYYDCKAGEHAEAFARRALSKINELSQLESMSSSPERKEIEDIFRQATVRMAIMVYRRTVFESRKKPKGILRPKTRANLKDASQQPWPRTQSEKLLAEMVEGSAAQMLCVLETIADTNRRTLLTAPPAADSEVEILDVVAELFMAGQEIIAGGGGTQGSVPNEANMDMKLPGFAGLVHGKSLMEMATKGEDGVPLGSVVKVVKWAYCYEQWDVYDNMLEPTMTAIRDANKEQFFADLKALEILQAYDKVVPRTKQRRLFANDEEEDPDMATLPPPPKDKSEARSDSTEDLINLAEVLLSIVKGPFKAFDVDQDMVVDACLFLWSKCKAVFQKCQTGSTDNPRYLQRMEKPDKWVYILDIVHQVLGWCGLSAVDPALTAEVSLRLALVFDASATLELDGLKSKSGGPSRGGPGSSIDSASELARDQQNVGLTASRASGFSSPAVAQNAREQLLQARDILESGLDNVSYARHVVARGDGKSIADIGWVKELNADAFPTHLSSGEEERDDANKPLSEAAAVWNTIKDLHTELIFMYHRVCLRLASLGPDPTLKAPKPFKRRTCSKMQHGSSGHIGSNYIETVEELAEGCLRNQLTRALFNMQHALILEDKKPEQKLIEEAKSLLQKAQSEEKRTFLENSNVNGNPTVARVPPAPLLLSRTDTTMVFKPAPFNPVTTQKVAWYRIFCRTSTGSNVKVRLNDYHLPGTGEQVPAFHCELRVSGLTPGEKYVFAVAAYTADGKLIGNVVGESTKPILASHPLPVLLVWAYLCQVSYQVGQFAVAKEACQILWNHFVAEPPASKSTSFITTTKDDFKLTLYKLNLKLVSQTSPVLLRMFLTSMFIHVDTNVKEGALFCDTVCDQGPLSKRQLSRLEQCEKMLVCLELTGWLNESNLALQAIVQCYGLLAPIIHFKIPSVPAIQVLERCHVILQEIPAHLRTRRTPTISESLHHMTACLTYHLAKVLRTWNQRALAASVNENGRKMLSIEPSDSRDVKQDQSHEAKVITGEHAEEVFADTDTGSITLAALKRKKTKKGASVSGKDDADMTGNEELRALEAHMLRLSKQAQGEHELTGNEDPSILHAYIAYLPSRLAYKEVSKFKRRARYLEFLVQVSQKALQEGQADLALDWCEEGMQWLAKRNEQLVSHRGGLTKQPGVVTVIGDDPKKYAAAVVEYTRDKESSPRSKDAKKGAAKAARRKQKYKAISLTPNMSEAQKLAQEEAELEAIDVIQLYFLDLVASNQRRKRLRKICADEGPWRSQLNIVVGLGQFGVFLHRLELREKFGTKVANPLYHTSFMDQEWFTFETAGTLVVGWEGGPNRQVTRQESRTHASLMGVHGKDQAPNSGIEIAAAAATGKHPANLYTIPQEEENHLHTYRSEAPPTKRGKGRGKDVADSTDEDAETAFLKYSTAVEMLGKTFSYFRRAVVLAHRGHHWTLLQNACRAMWNCAHTALLHTYSSGKGEDSLLDVQTLQSLLWNPFYTAADCLMDMMIHLQATMDSDSKVNSEDLDDGLIPLKSWIGSVEVEKGGASLKFESYLDDISSVDMRCVRRIVLRAIEMLYHEQCWERLVDIALRFNALTDDRYAEQVNPLLIQAQRKLIARVSQYAGPKPPQAHFQLAKKQTGGPITAKIYAQLQLHIQVKTDEHSDIDPGVHIDPEGHDAYSGGIYAKRLVCVPLDVSQSMLALRTALDNSRYTSRALQHSRKLLVLYLAGQQNGDSGINYSTSRVDFNPSTASPVLDMPPDTGKEQFLSSDDVQASPLSRSQISVVMSSYNKTIELLLAKNQKGLAAEAMKELGNLHYHTGNVRGAYKWWSEALDVLLGTTDAIHSWHKLKNQSQDVNQALLTKCGLWGCILGGVLASNIAQYILTSDLGLRSECCFLSAYFFKALFRSSLPHPAADRDYALYEVGEGCEVTNLVPGIDLLSERFRCDGRTLAAALRFVMDDLARGRHNLFVLPLLTLYQFFTTFVCRDLQRTVDGRILKVRILTNLGLYMEAFITLLRLLNGERLPHTSDSNFRQTEARASTMKFDSTKPVLDSNNLKVIESLLDKRLSSSLGTLYGPHLTCNLSLVQAHLFIALADTMPVLPVFDEVCHPGTSYIQPHTISTFSRGGKGPSLTIPSKLSQTSHKQISKGEEKEGEEEGSSQAPSSKRFSGAKKPVTVELVKGALLATADQMLATVSEIIIENAQLGKGVENLSPAEMELVIQCKLELAAIAQQRHHAALAARIVLSTLRMLQSADMFKDKRETLSARRRSTYRADCTKREASPVKLVEPDNSQFEYQNFQSRARLDVRLWLVCRLELVKSMMGEIRGMGQVKGSESKVKVELADVRHYCAEGVAESEACGDVEMQAEFLLRGAVLDIMEGSPVDHTKELLQHVLELLSGVKQLSMPGRLLHALSLVHLTDLEAAAPATNKTADILTTSFSRYCEAQRIILEQLCQTTFSPPPASSLGMNDFFWLQRSGLQDLGEQIEHHYPAGKKLELSTPVSPLRNLYLPHFLPLVQVKLRLGHAMARKSALSFKQGQTADIAAVWAGPLGVMTTALQLIRVITTRTASIEAEILLNMGKVQRMMHAAGQYNTRAVADTLLNAITTSFTSDHDLGLMRQAYLELGLLYLASSGQLNHKDLPTTAVAQETRAEEDGSETQRAKKRTKGRKTPQSKNQSKDAKAKNEDLESQAAWTAIRCAAALGQAMRSRLLLVGESAVTAQPVGTKAQNDVPEFAFLDMLAPYVLGERKKVYKNEIEEELAPLTEALEPPPMETYEDQLNNARQAAAELSWLQILGYQGILQRLCSTSTLTAIKEPEAEVDVDAGDLGSEFDLGFISHAQFDVSLNHDVVRSILFSPTWTSRLTHLHTFLTQHLPAYGNTCSAIYPPVALTKLKVMEGATITQVPIIRKLYDDNKITPLNTEQEGTSTPVNMSIPGSNENPFKPSDKPVTSAGELEVTLQWYQPSLDCSRKETSSNMEPQVMLLYVVNRKSEKTRASCVWVSISQLMALHDRLTVLCQRGEISLIEKEKEKKKEASEKGAAGKTRKQTRIKALSPKLRRDETLEALLLQCMEDSQNLFGIVPEEPSVSPTPEVVAPDGQEDRPPQPKIPFDVTKTNMHNFEKLFDASFGHRLTESKMCTWFSRLFILPSSNSSV